MRWQCAGSALVPVGLCSRVCMKKARGRCARQAASSAARSGPSAPARHRDQPHVVGAQLLEQHEVARILHQHRIPGGEQAARQQVEGLRGAEGGDEVGGAGGDAAVHEPGGDVFAQLAPAPRAGRAATAARAGVLARRVSSARRRGLEQPVLGQKSRAGRDEVRALRQRHARQRQGVGARIGQGLDRGERCGQAPRGDEEAAPGARLDQAAGDQSLVGVDDGEGTGADLRGEPADRGQAGTGGQLAVAHQLAQALADLLDQRYGGFAAQLEHRRGTSCVTSPPSRSPSRPAPPP